MSHTTRRIAFALLSSIPLAAAGAANAAPLAVDHPQDVSGVEVACTGIGTGEEQEVRWKNFPVKIEVVNGRGQYLGDENVTVRGGKGNELLHLTCDAPWVMMELKPGRYEATVSVPNGASHNVHFVAPEHGQHDVIVRFAGTAA